MNIGGGEAADQLVRMMLSGSEVAVRLSGSAIKNVLALTMALAKKHKTISGKVNLAKMLKETRDVRRFAMSPEQYQQFRQRAGKQKILFSAIRDSDKLIMVRTKIFVKEDTKMLYTEKEKHEIERVKEVFAEHLRQNPDFELLWSDKVGYVWLTIGVNPLYVDTGIRIESAADLCGRCLDDVATDVLYMTGNDHALEAADPLELAEIKRRWEPYINQLPDYAYLCKDLLNGKM